MPASARHVHRALQDVIAVEAERRHEADTASGAATAATEALRATHPTTEGPDGRSEPKGDRSG